MGDAGSLSGGTADVVSAKGDDVSRERASSVQDLSSEMSRQIASTSGAAHAAASGDGRRKSHSSVCRWTLPDFTKTRARQVWSDFQTVGGRECRLLVYPKGDSMALPGYISAYLQVDAARESARDDATGASSTNATDADWECFVSYELAVVRPTDASIDPRRAGGDAVPEAGARRDSWHRFSSRKKSHGWCDFARSAVVLDPKNGYLVDDALVVEARIVFLNESSELVVEAEASRNGAAPSPSGEASRKADISPPVNLTGRFTWTIENFRHFAVMIKTQKVMSPSFVVGDCAFRLSAYQSAAGARQKKNAKDGADETSADDGQFSECLSLCLESKEIDTISGDKQGALSARTAALGAGGRIRDGGDAARVSKVAGDLSPGSGVAASRSCWLVFRVSAVHQTDGKKSVHRDSYGRFAGDAFGGDTTSLGWNDFMPMSLFAGGDDLEVDSGSDVGSASVSANFVNTGFLEGPDGRAVFTVSFHAAREACEARTHNRRSSDSGPATALLSPDGAVRATGGGLPDEKRGENLANRRRLGGATGNRGRDGRASDFRRQDLASSKTNLASNRVGVSSKNGPFAGDAHDVVGRFVWRLDNFTKLKDILKKRKMSGLSVKSRRFAVGGFWCRLIVYPRGQSHPPNHLSMFLEVTDPDASSSNGRDDVFVSHRLSVYNQSDARKSVSRESQNRYGRGAKDWGWREFLSLTTLFDEDAGFLVNDTVVFTAEVCVLRERVDFGPIPRDRLPPHQNQMRFNPKRLARFIARYGLEEKEAEAARFLFGDRFEEVKAAAMARAERRAQNVDVGALLATDIRDAKTQEAKRRALREALGGPEERERNALADETRDLSNDSMAERDDWLDADSDSDSDGDSDLEDVHIQTPSLAQMAYVKAATEAKLPVASRLVTERGMAPLEGEGVNVQFNWRFELFAAFKEVLETKKIYSRFFRAAPGVELRLGVYESWSTLCVYVEPEAIVQGAGGERNEDDSNERSKNHWVRYRLGLVHHSDARKTVWRENATCTRTRWTSAVSQLVKMDTLMDPANGFVVKDTVTIACEILDCCPWFDERQLAPANQTDASQKALPGARKEDVSWTFPGKHAEADGAAAVEALTETLSSVGLGGSQDGVAREFGRVLVSGIEPTNDGRLRGAHLDDEKDEEEDEEARRISAAKKRQKRDKLGPFMGKDVLGLGGLGLDTFKSELLDKDDEDGAGRTGGTGKPSGLAPPLSESLRVNETLRAALRTSGLDADRVDPKDVSFSSFPTDGDGSGFVKRKEDEPSERGAAFATLLRAVNIDLGSVSNADSEEEAEAALLTVRANLRAALAREPSARDAFPAAVRALLSPRGAIEAAAAECVSGIPSDPKKMCNFISLEMRVPNPAIGALASNSADPDARHRLAALCGCEATRGVVYERILESLLEKCGALNEALKSKKPAGSEKSREQNLATPLFETRVLLGALSRLCDVAVCDRGEPVETGGAEVKRPTPAPRGNAEATCARLAQVLNANWPSITIKSESGVTFTLHPRLLVASRVNQIVPRSAHGGAAGRSLVAPLLEGALGGYADDGYSTYFQALRFLDMRESDESVAFAKCVAAIERGGPTRSNDDGCARFGKYDDAFVAEAVDFAFFVAARRGLRAEKTPAETKRAEALAAVSSSFAEATRAALRSLELRAERADGEKSGLTEVWRYGDDHPVLESTQYWMLENDVVAETVQERLSSAFVSPLFSDKAKNESAEKVETRKEKDSGSSSSSSPSSEKNDISKPKKEKTKAERRAAAREAAEREADARELAAINAVVGKASFVGRTNEALMMGEKDLDDESANTANVQNRTLKESAELRARKEAALAPLAIVALARRAGRFAKTTEAAIRVALDSRESTTLRSALDAHPKLAGAARRWIRNVFLELDDGNFFDDDTLGQARALGVAAVASVLATKADARKETRRGDEGNASPEDGKEKKSELKTPSATEGVLAFSESLRAVTARHSRYDDDDAYDASQRRRSTREYATVCDGIAELLSCPFANLPTTTRTALTRLLASAFAGGGARPKGEDVDSDDDGDDPRADAAKLEALGAFPDKSSSEEAWVAIREKARADCILSSRDDADADPSAEDPSADDSSSSDSSRQKLFVLDTALAASRVLESGAARLLSARADAALARASAEEAAARAKETAKKLESDAAKLSRDKKTVASARAETELKAKRVADEARLKALKIERERDEMRQKARDAERAGDWARDEAKELRRNLDEMQRKLLSAETRARDAEKETEKRREELKEALRRVSDDTKREKNLAAALAAERARADRAEKELDDSKRAFFQNASSRRFGGGDYGGVGGGPAADDGRRGLRAAAGGAIGGDAPQFVGASPSFGAFSKGSVAAPIGPPGGAPAAAASLARAEPAQVSAVAPFAGGSLFGLGGLPLGGLGNGTWSEDAETWR